MNNKPIQPLTDGDKEFCGFAGAAGIVLSFACLLQNWSIMPIDHWITLLITAVFIYCMVAFCLLAAKKKYAPLCVYISGFLIYAYAIGLILLFVLYLTLIFSWIFVILVFYNITISIAIYAKGMPAKLKLYHEEKQADKAYWADKL